MVSRCSTIGTMSTVDDAALYQYAQLFAETESAADSLEEVADLVGRIESEKHPLNRDTLQMTVQLRKLEAALRIQVRQGRMAMRQFLVEFGMTPSARTRVKPQASPTAEDEWTEFDQPPSTK
jgi:transposase